MPELIIIFLVLVLLFGASRLPKLGSALGGALRGFKRAVDGGGERGEDPVNRAESQPRA